MRRLTSRLRRDTEQPVNPMDGLGNLVDAMLVLAVGIMLALILNWKVDITTVDYAAEPEDSSIPIDSSDISEAEKQELDEEMLQRIGALYYDEESGMYYAVMEDAS